MKYLTYLSIIVFLILNGCASNKKDVDRDILHGRAEPKPDDTLELLLDFSERSKHSLSEFDINEMIATADSMCESEIVVQEENHVGTMINRADRLNQIDYELKDSLSRYLDVPLAELKFRTLVKAQERLNKAFENNENNVNSSDFEIHGNYVFQQDVSWMLPMIQANQRYSRTKTRLLYDLIESLGDIRDIDQRRRTWLAIKRMLDEIDVQKSEVRYDPFQRNSEGLYLKKGELLKVLNTQQQNETEAELIAISNEIIGRIEYQFNQQRQGEFWDRVDESQEMHRRFHEERSSDSTSSEDFVTAGIWFDEAVRTDSDAKKIMLYTKALELDPNLAPAYINRGTACKNLAQYDKALADYSRAIDLKPEYAPVYLNRANLHQKMGNHQQAVDDYSKAIELEPGYMLAFYYRGISYCKQSLYLKAREDFDRAVELSPKYVSAWIQRGNVNSILHQDDLSIGDYSRAIELDPVNPAAYDSRGVSYRNLRQYERAIADHRKAIELDPKFSEAYYNLGRAYWGVQDWYNVIRAWEQCLAIDPDHEIARQWLPKAKEAARMNSRR